jgi:hypothetical protein
LLQGLYLYTNTENTHTQTPYIHAEWDSNLASEREKTVQALDRSATMTRILMLKAYKLCLKMVKDFSYQGEDFLI